MPIEKKLDIEGAKIAVWKITENETELINLCNNQFIQNLNKLTHDKTRIQWLASRALLS